MGCPIRKSAGQRFLGTSPQLIAAVRVLLRLREPRHPPCALSNLSYFSLYCRFLLFYFQHVKELVFVYHYTNAVENNGFEPLTPCVQGRCSSQLS